MKQQMEYKSNRSDQFREWLKDMTPEKILFLVELERHARMLVHYHDLVGDFDPKIFHGLARSAKKLQADYEPKKD